MDNFIVSARKYRPQHFNTVVGQSHITGTLKNAIISNQLAQAYLFCGPRGVGKTTCARIFAKTINCFSITNVGEACDKCESCISFNSGGSLNVHELDAASNSGVEDIRNLVDQVRFAPQLGQYKVYIIDEVHMLSNAAFNAFLKTLEEPPKHAKFILATTEKHKIIPTILSRCQVFNFNRIKAEDISSHLNFMSKNENVSFEPEALLVIAQKADGSLRDACSIFDQMVAFTGNHLTYKQVIENLHVLDYDYYFKITDFFLAKNISEIMLTLDDILKRGFDGHNFLLGLGEHLRNLLVSKDPQTTELLEVSDTLKQLYISQAQKLDLNYLLRALSLISKTDVSYKNVKNQRLLIEIALMQITFLNSFAETEKKKDEIIPISDNKIVTASAVSPVQKIKVAEGPEIKIAEKPTIAFNELKIKSGFSLNEVKIAHAVKEEKLENSITTDNSVSEKKEVTFEEVKATILAYAENKQQQGLRQLSVSLSTSVIGFDKDTISITVNNETQREQLQNIKQELVDEVRKQLNSMQLLLEICITESDAKTKAYKPGDIFKHGRKKSGFIRTKKKI